MTVFRNIIRTISAVLVSSAVPVIVIGLWFESRGIFPLITIFAYGWPLALITVILTFLPFHLHQVVWKKPHIIRYIAWGTIVSGGLWAALFAATSEEISINLFMSFLAFFSGFIGSLIFYLVAAAPIRAKKLKVT